MLVAREYVGFKSTYDMSPTPERAGKYFDLDLDLVEMFFGRRRWRGGLFFVASFVEVM